MLVVAAAAMVVGGGGWWWQGLSEASSSPADEPDAPIAGRLLERCGHCEISVQRLSTQQLHGHPWELRLGLWGWFLEGA